MIYSGIFLISIQQQQQQQRQQQSMAAEDNDLIIFIEHISDFIFWLESLCSSKKKNTKKMSLIDYFEKAHLKYNFTYKC